MEEIFTTINLSIAGKCELLEGKGKHFFKAISKSQGDNTQIIKYLMLELIRVNGKKLTEDELNEMHMRDISYISMVMESMLSDEFINGI